MKKQVKEIKQYYCTCETDCIHKKGIVKRTVVTRPYSIETIKNDGCTNSSKDCNCAYRRRISG